MREPRLYRLADHDNAAMRRSAIGEPGLPVRWVSQARKLRTRAPTYAARSR